MSPRRSIRLTKRSVEALRAPDKDTLFWDRDLAGFGVRVHPSGRKVYVVQSRGPHGSKRVSLGCHGEITADAARKRAATVIGRIKRGEDLETEPKGPFTVESLAERFLRVYVAVHCKPGTVRLYRNALKNQILPALGARAVESIGTGDAIALHRRLHATPHQANQAIRVFSRMMTLAQDWELYLEDTNPCRSVKMYKVPARERFLSREEFRRLGRVLNEAESDGSVGSGAIAAVRLLVLTGCRRSEILSLRWDDVDRTAGVLRLRDSKTGPRSVPLTRAVAAVLERLPRAAVPRTAGSEKVIAGERFGGGRSRFHQHWKTIRERAGLNDVRLHDLRHSYASWALGVGENLQTIGRLLGHRKIGTTARYAHLVRDAEQAAAGRVGRSIGAHLEPDGSRVA